MKYSGEQVNKAEDNLQNTTTFKNGNKLETY